MTTALPGDAVVAKLVTFGRILREAGVEVGPGRLQDALRALAAVSLAQRDEVYAALACTLVAKRDDLEIFDAAFRAWFERAPRVPIGQGPLDLGIGKPPERRLLPAHGFDRDSAATLEPAEDAVAVYSSAELLRERDFATLTTAELRSLRMACERLARTLPRRLTRRLESVHDGPVLDPRETLRRAMRREGEPVERAFRGPKAVERRVVFLCDISGSMEPYARALVLFLQAAVAGGRRVEAFTFSTRLTRLTPFLDGRDAERALARAARAVPDWAGGTRIGEAIATFNAVHGRRGLTRGALVVIASDGWERGDSALLGRSMAELRRRARAVVWINPLKGSPDYRPFAAGMAAALPHVDVFLPGHNLASLETLVDVLAQLGERRPGTRRRAA